MLGVYNYMAAGVALTGVTAYLTSMMAVGADGQLTQFGVALYQSPLKWLVMLAPLGFVLFLSFRVEKMSVGAAQMTFWAVRRHHGRVAVVDLPGLHRPVDHADLLRHRRDVRRAQPVGLHDEA